MFSIVIPVFNESNNLDSLIKEIFLSLKNYNNFEIIIVNDGSTDDTLKQIVEINNKK